MMKSKAQLVALAAARDTGNAIDLAKITPNGSHMKMINRLVAAGLLNRAFGITPAGLAAMPAAPAPEPVNTAGPFRIRSVGEENGKPWTRIHGDPIIDRQFAERRLAELTARTARVYGKQPAPFVFELV